MKSYNCSKCHFFKTNTALSENSGECHRKSPTGKDANGLANGLRDARFFEAGVISDTIFSETDVYLYRNQFELLDEADPLPVSKGSTGLNSNEIFPFSPQFGMNLYSIQCTASLANTGAATIGEAPILKLKVYRIYGSTVQLLNTLEMATATTSTIGIFGDLVDGFPRFSAYVDPLLSIPSNALFGFEIELDTSNSEDYIAEIRNPMVMLRCYRTYSPTNPFSLIPDKTIIRCGEFKPLIESSNEKCWTCDHFEPANIGVDNSGHCMRNHPGKFDQATIPDPFQPNELLIDYTNLFPLISDGNDNYCGDFKPSTTIVPDPV